MYLNIIVQKTKLQQQEKLRRPMWVPSSHLDTKFQLKNLTWQKMTQINCFSQLLTMHTCRWHLSSCNASRCLAVGTQAYLLWPSREARILQASLNKSQLLIINIYIFLTNMSKYYIVYNNVYLMKYSVNGLGEKAKSTSFFLSDKCPNCSARKFRSDES